MQNESDGRKVIDFFDYYSNYILSDSTEANSAKLDLFNYLESKKYPYYKLVEQIANSIYYEASAKYNLAEKENDKSILYLEQQGLNNYEAKVFYARIHWLKAEIRFLFNDYKSGIHLYNKALNVALENGDQETSALIYFNIAGMMFNFPELESKVEKYINQAQIDEEIKNNDFLIFKKSFEFLNELKKGNLQEAKSLLESVKKYTSTDNTNNDYIYLIEAKLALQEKNKSKVFKLLTKFENSVNKLDFQNRMNIYMAWNKYFELTKNSKAQIENLRKGILDSRAFNDKTNELDFSKELYQVFLKKGDKEQTLKLAQHIIALTDSAKVNRAYLLGELDKMIELSELNREKKIIIESSNLKTLFIYISVAFLIAVLLFLLFIYKQNINLKFSNQKLLEKNKKLISLEKIVPTKKEMPSEKLNETELDLLERIKTKFTSEKVYLNDDLKLVNFSKLINSNTTYVSNVINKHYQKSFSSLINEYRVKESLKLLENNATQNYTIEYISKKSGFKSRTAFYKSFKDYTGLLPSYYMKANKDI
jgi:AraC-like DNA-binding protein